ncbi:MAG: tyrosine-type recombinase/integrase [Planctomycetia bacterium]|nr:tyrosine-type recombinase/integrase [Planctomycetia bacterium]
MRERAADIDPFEGHRKRPLAEHLEDFELGSVANGTTEKQAGQAASRCRKIIDACRFLKLADLSASAVANYLLELRKNGLAIQTSNHYLAAIKSFANWLVNDGRMPSSPLAHLEKLNAKVDVRHERRALSAAELSRVIAAAEVSEKIFRGLDGSTRAMIYRVAVLTGMRAKELASLSQKSFDLESDEPTWTLEAGYSKRRRKDCLPLHHDLVVRLRQWFLGCASRSGDAESVLSFNRAAEAKRERLFPGTWAEKGAMMLRIDLEAAGIGYLTDDGYADFHGLRHTFVSNLVASGVSPKIVQILARHSTITLTMDRYAHIGSFDLQSGLASLPSIPESVSASFRATGTLDEVPASFGCTNGCTRPDEINHYQVLSVVTNELGLTNEETRVSPQKTQGNTGFLGIHPAGLEPATFGSVV